MDDDTLEFDKETLKNLNRVVAKRTPRSIERDPIVITTQTQSSKRSTFEQWSRTRQKRWCQHTQQEIPS
jgi:hypothetical protein